MTAVIGGLGAGAVRSQARSGTAVREHMDEPIFDVTALADLMSPPTPGYVAVVDRMRTGAAAAAGRLRSREKRSGTSPSSPIGCAT